MKEKENKTSENLPKHDYNHKMILKEILKRYEESLKGIITFFNYFRIFNNFFNILI